MSSSLTSMPLEGAVGVRCVCIVPSPEENTRSNGRNHRFDVVIIGNSVGVVACYDCSGGGSVLWRARVGASPIHFIVSLGSERLLVGCGTRLIVVSLHEGDVLGAWRDDREHSHHGSGREESDAALVGVTLTGGILGWRLYCGFVSGTVRSYTINGSSNGPSLRVEGSGPVTAISLWESPPKNASGGVYSFNGERSHTDDSVLVVVGTERGVVLVVDAVLNVLFKTRLGLTHSVGLHGTAALSVHCFTSPSCVANGKVFAVSSEAGQISLFSNDGEVGWSLHRTLPAVHDAPIVSLSSCESILVDCLVSLDVRGIICVWHATGSWPLLARISTFSGTPFVKVLPPTRSNSVVYAASVCGKLWDVGSVLTQKIEPARLEPFSSQDPFPTNTHRFYAEYPPHSSSVCRHIISSTIREATAFDLSPLISLIEEIEAFTRQEIECALLDAHRAHLMRWSTMRELERSLSRGSDKRHGDGPINSIGDFVPSPLLAAGQKLRCAESEATYWMRAFEASEYKRKKLLSDMNALRKPWEQMKMELSHREADLSDALFSREQERAELLSQIQTLREEVASRGRL